MPTGRRVRTRGAGPYTGYSKNFSPAKSSGGSVGDRAVIAALELLAGKPGPTRRKTRGLQFEEAGGLGKIAGNAAKAIAKAGTKAGAKTVSEGAKRAGKPFVAAGKTSSAVAKDAATAAARRTPAESRTIAAGTRRGRSAAKAIELEKQSAAANSSKSVNAGPKSPVQPRTTSTGTVSKGITKKRMAEFAETRGSRPAYQPTGKAVRTPAQAKRAQADLEESLKRGAQLRAEGRAPGADIPGSTGRGIYEPKPAPATPPKVQARETVSKALKKPTNPGKNASAAKKAKYEKDLAAWEKRQADMKAKTKAIDEGRLKVDGTPKGATAKSIRRQESKRAKNKAAVEKPASKATVKKPSAKSPKAKAEAVKAESGRDMVTRNSGLTRRGGEVIQGRVIKGGRTREPIDLKTRPVGGERPAIGRPANTPARTGSATKRPIAAIEAGTKAKGAATAGSKKRGKKGLLAAGVLGGTAAAGLIAKQFDSGKSPNDTAGSPAQPTGTAKAKDYVRDNKGRKISRDEFEKRKEFREKYGLTMKPGESRTDYRKRVEEWKKKHEKKTKREMERRKSYRETLGKSRFGMAATEKTRKAGVKRVGFDSDARKALR